MQLLFETHLVGNKDVLLEEDDKLVSDSWKLEMDTRDTRWLQDKLPAHRQGHMLLVVLLASMVGQMERLLQSFAAYKQFEMEFTSAL